MKEIDVDRPQEGIGGASSLWVRYCPGKWTVAGRCKQSQLLGQLSCANHKVRRRPFFSNIQHQPFLPRISLNSKGHGRASQQNQHASNNKVSEHGGGSKIVKRLWRSTDLLAVRLTSCERVLYLAGQISPKHHTKQGCN
jgi:hypothetical protein